MLHERHNQMLKRVRHEVADVLLISFLIMRDGSSACHVADSFLLRHASSEDAVNDLNEGKSFYESKETGVGDYFWDTLLSDIESLALANRKRRVNTDAYQ